MSLEALLAASRPWTLRREVQSDGSTQNVWRNGVSGATLLYTPEAVLVAEAALGKSKEAAARALAAAWEQRTAPNGKVYYEAVEETAGSSGFEVTWLKPRELRELHALEFENSSRALRAEASDWVSVKDEHGEYFENSRLDSTTRDVPACITRLARADEAEAARRAREEANDWDAVLEESGDTYWEHLDGVRTTRERPAALAKVAELDKLERLRRRALDAGWLVDEDEASGALFWHFNGDVSQWDVPTLAEIRLAARATSAGGGGKALAPSLPPPAKTKAVIAAERSEAIRRLCDPSALEERKAGAAAAAARDGAGAIESFTDELRRLGLRSSQMLVFVDFSAANADGGRRSLGGRSLHDLAGAARSLGPNPYEEVLSAVAATMADFDADGKIPFFGFAAPGTASGAGSVFPITQKGAPEGAPCEGLSGVLAAYRRAVLRIAPSAAGGGDSGRNLIPVVKQAIESVRAADADGAARELTICLIVLAGEAGQRILLQSALVDASQLPIVFVIVGVGDGPFQSYSALDDSQGQRRFDNVAFVELEGIRAECTAARAPLEVGLALAALAELPNAFTTCSKLGYVGSGSGATNPPGAATGR